MQEAQTVRPTPAPEQENPDIVKKNGQAAPEDQGGPTLFVREFKLENVEYLSEAEIQKVLEPFKGRNLTMSRNPGPVAGMGRADKRRVDALGLVEPLGAPTGPQLRGDAAIGCLEGPGHPGADHET